MMEPMIRFARIRSVSYTHLTKIEGKPFFLIYDPVSVPKEYIDNFRKWTKEAGFPDLFLVCLLYTS